MAVAFSQRGWEDALTESTGTAKQIKDNHRKMWALGDYSQVAGFLQPASDALADACGIDLETTVLDVGCGTGNLALTAARRGAQVVATDLTPELLEIAKQRAASEGLELEWQIADAEELPFERDRFDVVTSVFGAMFAPHAAKVAEEMLRVTKPGGVVGFTSWANDGYTGRNLELTSSYGPPTPPGIDSVGSWGDESVARKRFEDAGATVEVTYGNVVWDFESLEAAREFNETNVPPMVAAKMRMDPEKYEEMVAKQRELQQEFNRGENGRVTIDAKFLVIVARKPSA